MTARVLNKQRLNAKLKRLPQVAEAEIRKAIAKSAEAIVAIARSLVPVDEGKLRDSIGWTWGEAPEGAKVLGSSSGGVGLTATIYAGDNEAFYARWQEFGTVKAAAQPFFFPAYRAEKKRAKGRIRRAASKAARMVA